MRIINSLGSKNFELNIFQNYNVDKLEIVSNTRRNSVTLTLHNKHIFVYM